MTGLLIGWCENKIHSKWIESYEGSLNMRKIFWAVFSLLEFGFVYASGIVTQGFCEGIGQTLSFKKD